MDLEASRQLLIRHPSHRVLAHNARRKSFLHLIGLQVSAEPLMLNCMKLLGIGISNAFALVTITGEIRRFETHAKLGTDVELNPSQHESGRGKTSSPASASAAGVT